MISKLIAAFSSSKKRLQKQMFLQPFQRDKKLLRSFLTRWETLKKECRFRRSVLVGVHRYGREQIGGKQKILIKNPHDDADFFLI
ncbi:MAG: hypothetical protein IJN80_01510, partial [Clostridia bacterium]|nr:hypothetical protein [Clostridia bacterium]